VMVLALLLPLLAAMMPPNPIHDAATYMTLVDRTSHGVRYMVRAPDSAPLDVVHVFGKPRERGRAHGSLLARRLLEFLYVDMPLFYESEVASLDLSGLPSWLVAAIEKIEPSVEDRAAQIFDLALGWLEGVQRPFNTASASGVYDELDAIAEGMCAQIGTSTGPCANVTAVQRQLHLVNVLPDLIRMQCSMLGAWGDAVAAADGALVQMRSLDFGAGPFANNTLLLVHHPSGGAQPFASLTFPGFAGVVTGLSPSAAVSEKVNDLAGGGKPPGSYEGQSTAYVIRDMVQFATAKEEAATIAANATRTWGVWLGVGDHASQQLEVIEYSRASADTFDATTLPAKTGQPPIRHVAYVDKHPQPSTKDDTLPTTLARLVGTLSAEVVAHIKIPPDAF